MNAHVAAALRNEIESSDLLIREPRGAKRARVAPRDRIVVGTVEVEEDEPILLELEALPDERLAHACGDRGKERVVAAHLLHEPLQLSRFAGGDRRPAGCEPMKRVCGEDNEDGRRDGRTQQVQHFDRGDTQRQQSAVLVGLASDHGQGRLLRKIDSAAANVLDQARAPLFRLSPCSTRPEMPRRSCIVEQRHELRGSRRQLIGR
mmetsp:Transcript_5310/g.20094  ORF Transcript_5310/g.20094 Transcript_5310/m.20094 type:complete len:205 (-) Transcript_5310:1694-2308(-)